MAKKPRLKTDAFDWVQDTTKKTKAEPPAEPETPRPSKPGKAPRAVPKSAPKAAQAKESKLQRETATASRAPFPDAPAKQERRVLVQYLKPRGEIVAMQELSSERSMREGFTWLQLPKDRDAAEILLTGELARMKLIDIHKDYKVEKSGRTAKLVRKT